MLSSQPYGAVNGAASWKDEILRITLIRDWKSCHLPSTPVCLTKHFPMCTPFGVALFPAFPSPSRTPTICFGFRTTQPDHELMNTALFLRLNIAHKRLQTRKKSKIRLITFCASRICCALNPLKGISLKDKQLGDQKRKIEKKRRQEACTHQGAVPFSYSNCCAAEKAFYSQLFQATAESNTVLGRNSGLGHLDARKFDPPSRGWGFFILFEALFGFNHFQG